MSKCLITDFETLDTIPSAAITTMSFLVFDPADFKPFDELVKNALTIKLNWQEQVRAYNRTTSEDTLNFWRDPCNEEAFNACVKPSPDDVSITQVNEILLDYLNQQGYNTTEDSNDLAYCRGNTFDFGMLEHVYRQFNWSPVIQFWNYRDVRTEIDAIMQHVDSDHVMRGNVNYDIEGFVKHNSAHDCAKDVMWMQYAHYLLMKKMGEL